MGGGGREGEEVGVYGAEQLCLNLPLHIRTNHCLALPCWPFPAFSFASALPELSLVFCLRFCLSDALVLHCLPFAMLLPQLFHLPFFRIGLSRASALP